MKIEYIILLILSILPILYKTSFWLYLFQLKEYRLDRIREYFSTNQGKKALFNFWILIEIPIFIFSFFYLFYSPFEIILFNLVYYFLIIQNIFVIGKIFRKRLLLPKKTSRILVTFLFFIIIDIFLAYFLLINNLIYLYIFINIIFTKALLLLSIIFSLPIVNYTKSRLVKKATKISLEKNKMIKIGITGSYGKSSVKEYLGQILSEKYKTLITPKNINTQIGVSNFIINKLKNKYDFFVAEMGAYKKGEIRELGELVNHKYGFITAIGNQHLSLFGSIENTIKGKSEIAEKVLENEGILYINWDNKNIRKAVFNKKLKIVKYGTRKKCDAISEIIEVKKDQTSFIFKYKDKNHKYKTNLLGKHNIINITGIIAFCYDIGLKKSDIKDILLKLKLPDNTLEIKKKGKNIIINDTYNLSEASLFSGLDVLNIYSGDYKEKILVVDDIIELGKESEKIHFEIGKKIAKKKLASKVYYVGLNYRKSFVTGLISGGFKLSDIVEEINDFKKSIILFEGRKAKNILDNLK